MSKVRLKADIDKIELKVFHSVNGFFYFAVPLYYSLLFSSYCSKEVSNRKAE